MLEWNNAILMVNIHRAVFFRLLRIFSAFYRDHIILGNYFFHSNRIKLEFFNCFIVDSVIYNISPSIFPCDGRIKCKISAIMEESIIIRIIIFPCPILSCQFTVCFIPIRNIVTFIVMKHPFQFVSGKSCSDLNRIKVWIFRNI